MTHEEFNELCRQSGMTVGSIAATLGVSRETVHTWQSSGVPRSRAEVVRSILTGGKPSESLVNVNVRLAAETLRKLDEAADAEDRSRSQMVRLLLERALS